MEKDALDHQDEAWELRRQVNALTAQVQVEAGRSCCDVLR